MYVGVALLWQSGAWTYQQGYCECPANRLCPLHGPALCLLAQQVLDWHPGIDVRVCVSGGPVLSGASPRGAVCYQPPPQLGCPECPTPDSHRHLLPRSHSKWVPPHTKVTKTLQANHGIDLGAGLWCCSSRRAISRPLMRISSLCPT